VPAAPAASCAKCWWHTSVATTGPPGSPGIPSRNGFNGLYRALLGDRAFLSPSLAKVAFHKLDAGVEASGPHDFAVRFSTVRYRHLYVHRIPPRVRDDREPPLKWDGTAADMWVIWVEREAEYFWKQDWTGGIRLIGFNKFCPARTFGERRPAGITTNSVRRLPSPARRRDRNHPAAAN
jgi:hypothetical protein